jgi:hypothetical protein
MKLTDEACNVIFLLFVAALSFGFEFVFFAQYAPKSPGEMPDFITREKGKCMVGLVVSLVASAYSYSRGNGIWTPLPIVAFVGGAFAAVKYKEIKIK